MVGTTHNLLKIRFLFLCSCKFLFALFDSLFDSADEVKRCFRQIIDFAVQNHIEALDCVFNIDEFAFEAGELFSNVERL